ncbi:MAG: helix-turn-helix transcriptional regulator [Planctomycetota bacterium]|jgi:predicted DNA-binding transcriptional regulator AlpA
MLDINAKGSATATLSPTELIDVKQVAKELQCSVRQVWRLVASAKIPPPLRIGGMRRWRASDIQSWIKMGFPRADDWANLMRRGAD